MILQILMFDVQKQMVVDIWESDDRKLLLRCLKNNGFADKAGWNFGDAHTFTVYECDGNGVDIQRKWELKIAIPRGCKTARPCVDGVDFLTWDPDNKPEPSKDFGWTVAARGGDPKQIHAYKRDCPADAAHFAADLAPFTHTSKAKAVAAGKRGEYAYKRPLPDIVWDDGSVSITDD